VAWRLGDEIFDGRVGLDVERRAHEWRALEVLL
jgi:hypothetical protein